MNSVKDDREKATKMRLKRMVNTGMPFVWYFVRGLLSLQGAEHRGAQCEGGSRNGKWGTLSTRRF